MGIESCYLSYMSLIESSIRHLVTTNNFLSFRCGNDQHTIQYRDGNDLLLTISTSWGMWKTFNLYCGHKTTHLEICHLQPYQCKHVLMIQIVRKFSRFKHIDDGAVSLHWTHSIVEILHSYICIIIPKYVAQYLQSKV